MFVLALTMGDPAGIAGEITAGAWRRLRQTGPAFVALCDPDWLAADAPVQCVDRVDASGFCDAIPVLPVPLARAARRGAPDAAHAPAIVASIERAFRLAASGEASGMVTNPIAKSVLTRAGFPHPGHTEFLASLAGCAGGEVMMLASPDLRVVPVTVHVSLRDAIASLAPERIVSVARITHQALRGDFGIAAPRLAVAGLNPHAGEDGTMGREEIDIVAPAIAALRAEGIDASGPYPPDTLFTARARPRYDAAICLYHDQALIPLKTLDMDGGVNVTLGLPVVRTSPDHGTAFDIAGQGIADPASLVAAIRMADRIARQRRVHA